MYSSQQRHLLRFLFILRAHSFVYLIINNNNNNNNNQLLKQSTLPLTEYGTFTTFDLK